MKNSRFAKAQIVGVLRHALRDCRALRAGEEGIGRGSGGRHAPGVSGAHGRPAEDPALGWAGLLPLLQGARARALPLAEGHRGQGCADTGANGDALGRDRLAPAALDERADADVSQSAAFPLFCWAFWHRHGSYGHVAHRLFPARRPCCAEGDDPSAAGHAARARPAGAVAPAADRAAEAAGLRQGLGEDRPRDRAAGVRTRESAGGSGRGRPATRAGKRRDRAGLRDVR